MIRTVASPELMTMPTLEETINAFTSELLKSFPRARWLLGNNADADSEADVEIDVYVPPEEIESAGIKADELALDYDLKSGVFIIPIILPLDAYPAK